MQNSQLPKLYAAKKNKLTPLYNLHTPLQALIKTAFDFDIVA